MLEFKADKIDKNRKLSSRERDLWDSDLTETGLCQDVSNTWGIALGTVENAYAFKEMEMFDSLRPILRYREYYDNKYPGTLSSYIKQISNPETIAQYDAVVDEYNSGLERIKKERDGLVLVEFVNKARRVVRGGSVRDINPKERGIV